MTRLQCFNLILISIFGLTACDLSGKKPNPLGSDGQTANFAQQAALSGTMETEKVDGVFQTPKSRLLNMKVCLLDNLYQRPAGNQPFTIWEQGKRVGADSSDEHGCIDWQETLEFNYFATSEYVKTSRTIRGEGAFGGQIEIAVALNPWMHGEPGLRPVVDLGYGKVPALTGTIQSLAKEETAELWAKDIDLKNVSEVISDKKFGFRAMLELPTQFMARTTMSTELPVLIATGRYKITGTFYSQSTENGARTPFAHIRTKQDVVVARDGKISAEIEFEPSAIPSRGLIKVELDIQPVNGPKGLGGLKKSFEIGQATEVKWAGNLKAQLDNSSFNNVTTATVSPPLDQQSLAPPQTTGYRIQQSDTAFRCIVNGQIMSDDSINRRMGFQTSICLARPDGVIPRPGTPVKFNKFESPDLEEVLPTNDRGCIDIADSVPFSYFENDCAIEAKIKVNSPELGVKDQYWKLAVTPWAYDSYSMFCKNAHNLAGTQKQELENPNMCRAKRPPSTIELPASEFVEQGPIYEIDSNLNFSRSVVMRLGLYPQVERPHSRAVGDGAYEPLKRAVYLLRYVLVRNPLTSSPLEAFEYINGGEVIDRATVGRWIADIQLKMDRFELIDTRNRLLVQMHLLDDRKVMLVDGQWKLRPGVKSVEAAFYREGTDHLQSPVFEAPVAIRDSAFLTFDTFRMSQLEGLPQRQLKRFDGIKSTVKFSEKWQKQTNFKDLGELLEFGREVERLDKAVDNINKAKYLVNQNLVHVTKAKPASARLTHDKLMAASYQKQVDGETFSALCEHWLHDKNGVVPMAIESFGNRRSRDLYDLKARCRQGDFAEMIGMRGLLDMLGSHHIPFFLFQNVIISSKAKFADFARPGTGFNMTTGDSFSMGSRYVHAFDIGAGLSKILSVGVGATWRQDRGSDLAFTANQPLDGEENSFLVDIEQYRRCVIVRMNPNLLKTWPLMSDISTVREESRRARLLAQLTTRGLVACGEIESSPLRVAESYFYIQTTRSKGAQHDAGDVRNRYYVQLRGQRDMAAFIQAGRMTLDHPPTTEAGADNMSVWRKGLDSIFTGITPASPGVYLEDVFY